MSRTAMQERGERLKGASMRPWPEVAEEYKRRNPWDQRPLDRFAAKKLHDKALARVQRALAIVAAGEWEQ